MTMATTQRPPEKKDLTWRERMEIVPGQHRPHRRRNGAIFIAFCVIFLWILYTKPSLPLLSGGGTTLRADFINGINVRPGYTPVRVHGVEVGVVTGVKRRESGRGVEVKMKLEKGSDVKLHQDARMALRWRTLLGRNIYVDIDPGSPSAPELKGGFVPINRTIDQVELDQVLEPLDATGRKSLQTMIREFDAGFSSPKDFQNAVDAVEPAMRPLSRGVRALRGQQPGTDLPRLIARTSRMMGALARDEVALRGVIDNGNIALGATAAHSADLAATVNTAPAAMRETRTTLARLETTLDILDPLAEKLLPGAAKLDGSARKAQIALRAATPLLRDLRPALRDLRPAVTDLGNAARSGAPAFDPLSTVMDRVKNTYIPFLNAKNDENKRPNYQNVGPAVASVATATSWGDYNGPVANFEAAVGPNAFVDSPCKINFAAADVAQLVQCELVTRAVSAALTGRKPQDVQIRNSAVPLSKLLPYLKGHAVLKSHPRLKPLRVRGTK
jgi:ABC-type transporter Mla subunit MlaD